MKNKRYSNYKWMVWSTLSLSFIIVMFLRLSTGVISDNLSNELGFTAMQISNISSITLYSYAVMQIPGGILIDKYGPRKTASIFIIIAGIGSILFGMAKSIEVAYISRFMVGFGSSVIAVSVYKIQGNWFREDEYSQASAKFALVGNIGAVLSTFPLVFLTEAIGWRGTFYLIGAIGIIMGIMIFACVRNNPHEYGFENCLNVQINEVRNLNNTKVDNKSKFKDGINAIIKNKATWYNSFIMFSLVGVTTAFTSLWGIPYIVEVYEISKSNAAIILSFMTYGLIVGSMIADILSKKFKSNPLNLVRIGGIINLFIWIMLVVIFKTKAPIIMLPVVFFIIGCVNMNYIYLFTDIKNNAQNEYCGVSTSVVNTSEFIGSGVVNMFIGFALGTPRGGYTLAFSIFIVMSIITIVASSYGLKVSKESKLENVEIEYA